LALAIKEAVMVVNKIVFIFIIVFCMSVLALAQVTGNIVFVSYQADDKIDPDTGEYPDMPHIYALQDEGYNVTIFYNDSLTFASDATYDTLLNADLIVMGRSTPSPGYGDHKEAWNDLPTPILNLELWNCRSNRLNWFNSDNMLSISAEGTVYNAIIEEPDDPVFEGWDTSAPIPWVVSPFDAVGVKDAGNGKVIARLESDSTAVFIRFEPEEEFYDGSGDFPGGHRTVIGNGRDNSGQAPFDYYNFTVESEQIFLAEVARMVNLGRGGDAVQERVDAASPSNITLLQNYPNPFNPTTKIAFEMQNKCHVKLVLYDMTGRLVKVITSGHFDAGFYEIPFDGSELPSGLYFYTISADDFYDTKKMVLMR
jgi:hypothetical protein